MNCIIPTCDKYVEEENELICKKHRNLYVNNKRIAPLYTMLTYKYPKEMPLFWFLLSFFLYRDKNEALLKNILMFKVREINSLLRSKKVFRAAKRIFQLRRDFNVDRSNFQNILNMQRKKLVSLYLERKKFEKAERILNEIELKPINLSPIFYKYGKIFYLIFGLIFILFLFCFYADIFSSLKIYSETAFYEKSFKLLFSFLILSIIPTLLSFKIIESIKDLYLSMKKENLIQKIDVRIKYLLDYVSGFSNAFWFSVSPIFLFNIIFFIKISYSVYKYTSLLSNNIYSMLFSIIVFLLIYVFFLVWYNLFSFVWRPIRIDPSNITLNVNDINKFGGLQSFGDYIEYTLLYCGFSIGLLTTLIYIDKFNTIISFICIIYMLSRFWLLVRILYFFSSIKNHIKSFKHKFVSSLKKSLKNTELSPNEILEKQIKLMQVNEMKDHPLKGRKKYNVILFVFILIILPICINILSHYLLKYIESFK